MAQSAPVRLIAFLTAAVALTIGLLSLARAQRKVTYHGRSLVEWQAALFDTSAGVRDTAAYALTQLAPSTPRALTALIRAETVMLADEDADVRADATSALIALHYHSPLVVPMVADVVDRSPSGHAREHGIQVLAALGPDAVAAAPIVTRAVSDSNAAVRLVAVSALGRLGVTADQLNILIHASNDVDPDVRAAAIETLLTIGAPPATLLQVAVRGAQDSDAGVRTQAAYALAATGAGSLVVDRLAQAASDSDPRVRGAAVQLLGRLGRAARSAKPVLERAVRDSDREVRRLAEEALVSVRSQ